MRRILAQAQADIRTTFRTCYSYTQLMKPKDPIDPQTE